jgi:4-amino-4-deoxy-L-arabinose transferase-like glycosyltransferase
MEYWVATAPLAGILPAVKEGLQDPPLYSLLLHFWMPVGQDEFSLRYLSLIFSLFTVLATIAITRKAFGRKESLVAGVLISLAPTNIRFAQEVGQYALMVCLLSWTILFLYLATAKKSWAWFGLWGLTATLTTYSYYGAFIVILFTAVAAGIYTILMRQRDTLLRLLVTGIGSIVLISPLIIAWLPHQFRGSLASRLSQLSFGSIGTEIGSFIDSSIDLLLFQMMGYQHQGWPWPGLPEWVVWLPFLLVLVAATTSESSKIYFPRPRRSSETYGVWRRGTYFWTPTKPRPNQLVIWLTVSFVFYYLIGRLGIYPFGARYSLILAPLLWPILAAGIVALQRLSRSAVVAALPLAALLLVFVLSPREAPEDLRAILNCWLSLHQPGDNTYVYYGAAPGFRYQLELRRPATPVPPLWYTACWRGEQAAYCRQDDIIYGRWLRALEPEQKKESILESLPASSTRLWLIFSHVHQGEDEAILSALAEDYTTVTHCQAENAATVLLQRQ